MGRKKRKTVVESAAAGASTTTTGGDNDDNDNDDDDHLGEDEVENDEYPPPAASSTSTTNVKVGRAEGAAHGTATSTGLAGSSDPQPWDDNNNSSSSSNGGGGKKATSSTASSGYAMTTHSAEIVDADIYVSDGSESDEDLQDPFTVSSAESGGVGGTNGNGDEPVMDEKNPNRSIQMVLNSARMGLMRKGVHHPTLMVQPNRQWSRQNGPVSNSTIAGLGGGEGDAGASGGGGGVDFEEDPVAAEERRKREQEEELAKLDPAQRAARLLAEKQRKLEEAKIMARKLESEENAGRDPCLFSKRTSFDIRFDQIDDKPWVRGGDMTDFFNYGFSEEDWLEYGEQQLMIRQELIDANRQKRLPDPSIVPVNPKRPKKQAPKVAVAVAVVAGMSSIDVPHSGDDDTTRLDMDEDNDDEIAPVAGPALVPMKVENQTTKDEQMQDANGEDRATQQQGPVKKAKLEFVDVKVGSGGAWG